MKSLIEYLMIFLVLLIFSPNNYLSLIYLGFNAILIAVCLIFYSFNKNKSIEISVEKKQFNFTLLITVIMMTVINIISDFKIVNLLFGATLSVLFVYYLINSLLKKDYLFNREFIDPKRLFEFYSGICLISIVGEVLKELT